VSASLLRHVSAEAVYLGIVPEGAGHGPRRAHAQAARRRVEAQQRHGLEMRTELAIGEAVTEITRNLSAGTAQMLVLGITDITQAARPIAACSRRSRAGRCSSSIRQPTWACALARDRRMKSRQREPNVIPGFGITLGFTTFFLCAIVLIPAARRWCSRRAAWTSRASSTVITSPRALASYRLSLRARRWSRRPSTWCLASRWPGPLVRYDFPRPQVRRRRHRHAVRAADRGVGHRIDRGVRRQRLDRPVPRAHSASRVTYTWIGITVALTLIGMPFVVRTVQPAHAGSAARSRRTQPRPSAPGRFYVFRRIIIVPTVLPAAAHRASPWRSRARWVNTARSSSSPATCPMKTEITPLLIVIQPRRSSTTQGAAALGCAGCS
jgi:sulfate transport system permease protein